MLKFIKSFFTGNKQEPVQEVPYKVEAPTPVSEQATAAVVESIAPAKKPAPKKQGGAPKKQGGNKPRKPKAPKAPKA